MRKIYLPCFLFVLTILSEALMRQQIFFSVHISEKLSHKGPQTDNDSFFFNV